MIRFSSKLKRNLPWLARYPFERGRNLFERRSSGKKQIIFTIVNHFEPGWQKTGLLNADAQRRRVEAYYKTARQTGETVRDARGTKFRHTHFFPAEQYDREILQMLAQMQAEDLGEVEVHLHHGIERPDTAENLRRTLIEFRDCLAAEHRCLSRFEDSPMPRYAFVHGNLALGNSANGKYCGVDDELQILADTGCFADFTLPTAPDETQIAVINKIYECGFPLTEKMPHRAGKTVRADGKTPRLPLIFTGPLVINWTRRLRGIPFPRIEEGALAANQPLNRARFNRWKNANITVKGKDDWVFVKLYCHGFFDHDQPYSIGEKARRFFSEIVADGAQSGDYDAHFMTAREAFNVAAAAIDGRKGDPHDFRHYRLRPIMSENARDESAANRLNHAEQTI